jgi:hypothetical protein
MEKKRKACRAMGEDKRKEDLDVGVKIILQRILEG